MWNINGYGNHNKIKALQEVLSTYIDYKTNGIHKQPILWKTKSYYLHLMMLPIFLVQEADNYINYELIIIYFILTRPILCPVETHTYWLTIGKFENCKILTKQKNIVDGILMGFIGPGAPTNNPINCTEEREWNMTTYTNLWKEFIECNDTYIDNDAMPQFVPTDTSYDESTDDITRSDNLNVEIDYTQ